MVYIHVCKHSMDPDLSGTNLKDVKTACPCGEVLAITNEGHIKVKKTSILLFGTFSF